MIIDDLDQLEVVSEPTHIRGGDFFSELISFINEHATTSDSSNTESNNYIYTRNININGETTSYSNSNQSSAS